MTTENQQPQKSDTNSKDSPSPQPLSQKSDAQLKREATARLKHLDSDSITEVMNEALGLPVKHQVSGFVNFLREHAVVGLAVGFVLGTQTQVLVKQFTTSFVDPILMFFSGNKGLSDEDFTLNVGHHSATFHWGAFVYSLIDFLVVLIVVYFTIKILKLDKLDKKQS